MRGRVRSERRLILSSFIHKICISVFECSEKYDIVVCATGRKVPIPGFPRKSLDAKMSIAITANFANSNTAEERRVAEIPGLSKQYDLAFFRDLERQRGIRLENIVYYKVVLSRLAFQY